MVPIFFFIIIYSIIFFQVRGSGIQVIKMSLKSNSGQSTRYSNRLGPSVLGYQRVLTRQKSQGSTDFTIRLLRSGPRRASYRSVEPWLHLYLSLNFKYYFSDESTTREDEELVRKYSEKINRQTSGQPPKKKRFLHKSRSNLPVLLTSDNIVHISRTDLESII